MLFKNVASQKIEVFVFIPSTALPKTGDAANLTLYVSKDHGSVTVLGDTSATEKDATNAKGVYVFDLTQAETNADHLSFTGKSTTSDVVVVPKDLYTRPPNAGALSIDSNGRIDVIKVAGTTQTAGDIIGDTNDIQTRLPAALVGGRMDSSVGALASGIATAIRALVSGTSDSGTTTTMVDAARTEADTDYWRGALLVFTSGTLAGQSRIVTGFVPGTDTITFAPPTTQVVGTQTYEIWPVGDFLRPATAGRQQVAVAATGQVGVNWADVAAPTTTVDLTGTTVKAHVTKISNATLQGAGTSGDPVRPV